MANRVFADGSFMLTTCEGHETALFTVRGKDHDLTPTELREMAKMFNEAAEEIEGGNPNKETSS